MLRKIMSLFRRNTPSVQYRSVTPYDVPPAPLPDEDINDRLVAGRARLDNHVATAERTVASLYHQFAVQAASKTRR